MGLHVAAQAVDRYLFRHIVSFREYIITTLAAFVIGAHETTPEFEDWDMLLSAVKAWSRTSISKEEV